MDDGIIVVHQHTPTPTQFTPQVVRYASILATRISNRSTPVGGAWSVSVLNDSGRISVFQFGAGASLASTSRNHYALRLLSSAGDPVAAGTAAQPAYARLEYKAGGWTEFDWTTGLPLRHRTRSGRTIELDTLPEEVATRVIEQDGVLRQIKTAGGLADLVQAGEQAFEVRLYAPAQAGAFDTSTGVYPVSGSPFRTLRLENASSSATDYGHVRIIDTWGAHQETSTFNYNLTLKEWQLTQGDNALSRFESKDIVPGPAANESTITRRLKNEAGTVISTKQTVTRRFAWGGSTVQEIQEPATLNQTTTYSYHETSGQPGYSKMKSRVNPDGYWESYTYDSAGRVIETASPWKDSALSHPLTGPRRIVSRSFTPLETADVPETLDARPRTITESVVTTDNGAPVVTKRTFHVYKTDAAGVYSEIVEQAADATAAYGATGNLRTTRVHYTTSPAQAGYDPVSAGRLHYVEREDGTRTTYGYTRSSSTPAAYFTVSEVRATAAFPDGIDGRSTRVDSIHDVRGYLVAVKTYLRSGGQWHLATTQTHTVDTSGFVTASAIDGRVSYAAVYSGPHLMSETDGRGVTTSYTYDALGKVESATREGIAASGDHATQAAITTTYLRQFGGLDCGCDGEVVEIISAGASTLETTTKKDPTGRLTFYRDTAGLETTLAYGLGGREVTRTSPDGGTTIELAYLDRRPRSVAGSGAVARYYDYGVNADGGVWTKVSFLSADGERWRKTTANFLGQVVKEEQPAADGGVLTTAFLYNPKGQLVRSRHSHFAGGVETLLTADQLTEYGPMGDVARAGTDVGADGALDLASADRVTDFVHGFAQHESAWWQVLQTKVYPELGLAAAVQVSELRTRVSGFSGTLAAETMEVDVNGNLTRRRLDLDQANRLQTLTETYPGSTLPAVSLHRNGLLVSRSSPTVAAATLYGYDALGRLVSVKEPRHAQASSFAYDAVTGQLVGQADAAGHASTLAYHVNGEAGAGRVKLVTDASGNTRRTAYDLLGRVTRQWGTASYPQAYTYTAFGELHTLTTWRDAGTADLNSATWPSLAGGDVTTWTYQASTGLLTRKHYADGKGTDYAYDKAGRLHTRTWARGTATVYGYASATGELTSVDYSDATPDLTTTYDRLGRPATVTDATGTRGFAYDPATLRLEDETLPAAFYGSRILKRDYEGTATGEIPGRIAGYRLGTVADPEQDFAMSYAYDNVGRLNGVASPSGAYTYGFSVGGDLLATLTGPVHTTTRSYEPDRDVLDVLENKVGTTTVSKFDYTVNAIGQRTERAQSGTAFAQVSTDVFGYNTKGEVTGATNAALPARNQGFGYDEIGNRLSFTTTSGTTSYTANNLNQYAQVSGFSAQPTYDFDGNQTTTGLGQAYVWDAENRLIAVQPVIPVAGDQKVQNTYDAQSRRVRRQVFTYASGAWSLTTDEKFIYDGWNLVAVYDATSSLLAPSSLLRAYTWGLDLSGSRQGAGGVGGLLAIQDGSSIYHYTYDANGNVSEVLDASGAIAAHYEYTAFGDTVVTTGSYAVANEYRFSTKPLDSASGLYYYGFRYYNPSTGRWLSRDPIEEEGGFNVYAAVLNDPMNLVDTDGRIFWGLLEKFIRKQAKKKMRQSDDLGGTYGYWLIYKDEREEVESVAGGCRCNLICIYDRHATAYMDSKGPVIGTEERSGGSCFSKCDRMIWNPVEN